MPSENIGFKLNGFNPSVQILAWFFDGFEKLSLVKKYDERFVYC